MSNDTFNSDEWDNTSSLNDTYDVDTYLLRNWGPKHLPLDIVVPITIVYVTIFVTGLVGNVAVCAVIIRNSSMHTATNCYLFSLAVSDLTVLLFGLPNELSVYWQQYPWILGETVCKLRAFITEMTNYASVLTIVAFSLERYLAICHPLHAYTMSGMERAGRIIAMIWLVAMISALPFAIYTGIIYAYIDYPSGGRHLIPESAFCAMLDENRPSEWPLYEMSTFIFFIVPMVMLCLLYLRIGIRIRRTSLGRGNTFQAGVHRGSEAHHSHSRRNILRMLVAVVIGFFICWAPFHAQRLLYVYGKEDPNYNEINEKMIIITGCFYYFSATINPILYNVMSARYREAFCETLCGCQSRPDKIREPNTDRVATPLLLNGVSGRNRSRKSVDPAEPTVLMQFRTGPYQSNGQARGGAVIEDETIAATNDCEAASVSPTPLIRSAGQTTAVTETDTLPTQQSGRRLPLSAHLNNVNKTASSGSGSLTAGCSPSCLKSSEMVRRLSESSKTPSRTNAPTPPSTEEETCTTTTPCEGVNVCNSGNSGNSGHADTLLLTPLPVGSPPYAHNAFPNAVTTSSL